MISPLRATLALSAALFALALPAAAAAAVYEVNTTLDEADKVAGAPCETNAGPGVCSLRAAIQVANGTAGVPDEITFAADPFDGGITASVQVGSQLPAITDQLKIRGGECDTAAGTKGPCAGVLRIGGGSLLVVDDDDVEIQGLALRGATTAIGVINASKRFVAKGNWIGFDTSGFSEFGPGNDTGIVLGPGSDEATIGGLLAADRNVIGSNDVVGLDLEGASDATIQGNYFGVTQDGGAKAGNSKDIEITDTASSEATGNEIGAAIQAASIPEPCDAGCNLISNIDLQGDGGDEQAATGSTTIRGNYVGMNAAGTGNITAGGIESGEAGAVTIGGAENGEGNYFNGGSSILHEDGKDFAVLGNVFGAGPTGPRLSSPPRAISISSENLGALEVDPVRVSGNVFRMEGGMGIESLYGNSEIEDNFIEGTQWGIVTEGDPPGAGSVIKDNVIGQSLSYGVWIRSDFSIVLHNSIYESGQAGIRVQNPTSAPLEIATGNLIGGDTAGEENTIRETDGPAIEIVDESGHTEEDSQNAVARNKGDSNAGLFIDLVGDPNGGILPPAFASVQSSASGSGAEPGATIRVFRKGTAAAGEIESFLGEAEANGSGDWKVTYTAAIPLGTNVAATQTSNLGGTSELSLATAGADPSGGGGGGAVGGSDGSAGGDGGGNAPASDEEVPTATITKGPKAKSTSTTAKFKFTSNEAGSRFECKLDKGKFKKCKSPKTYKELKPGKHVFKVRAIDKAGNVGKPAKRKFTVLS